MVRITVNCEPNNIVDIKAGGPDWLGFDFYINDNDNQDDYISFIKDEIKKNNLPLDSIYANKCSKPFGMYADAAWHKKMISDCIKRGY